MSGDHSHHEESFIRKYVFSIDHKVIGIQYGIASLVFLALGFTLMLIMRWQLANPGPDDPIMPVLGKYLKNWAPYFTSEGNLTAKGYNAFGAMHGTIMVFMGVVPLAVGAFGNYVVPLQIGAVDMAFPKLNMGQLLGVLRRGSRDADQLLCTGRSRHVRLDLLSASGKYGTDHLFQYHGGTMA